MDRTRGRDATNGTVAADRLIVAFDFATRDEALRLADQLKGRLRWAKVGLELFTAEGPAIVGELSRRGLRIFLDLKFHDIPNTVEKACASAARLGASLITIHAGGGEAMMEAAVRGAAAGAVAGGAAAAGAGSAGAAAPRILAVTVLTSLSGQELPGYHAALSMTERVLLLGRAARQAGIDGLVASPREVASLRQELGNDMLLVVPGIRFARDPAGDQKRVATPASAIADGADCLVIGRSVTRAPDPVAAFDQAIHEISAALSGHAGRDGATLI